RDQRGEESGLGQRRDELGRIGALAVERAPVFAGELGAERAHRFADLREVVGRLLRFSLDHSFSNPRAARLFAFADGMPSYRIPREYVGRALERGERRPERALDLLVDLFRRPAVGAMDGAHRARLVEQEDLVVAHAENLPGNSLGAVAGEV